MITRRLCAAVAAGVLVGGGPALASGEYLMTEWLDVGSETLGAGESLKADLDLTGLNGIVGFEVAFSFVQGQMDGSWASDARVAVDPGEDPFSVGGFTNLPSSDEEWSFQGPDSESDGRYGDSGDDLLLVWEEAPLDGGVFSVMLTNDRINDPNPNGYNDVQARFYYSAVPAPGALTLLGLAGLAGRRRRRV